MKPRATARLIVRRIQVPEIAYMHERRRVLGGYLPVRKPAPSADQSARAGVDRRIPQRFERAASLEHDGVRQAAWQADEAPGFGKKIVPIIPDEARTFGMESMFRTYGIYAVRRTALQAARFRHAPLLQGSQRRPDSRGRHHRSRFDGRIHGGRYGVCQLRRRYHSVLTFTIRCSVSSAWAI